MSSLERPCPACGNLFVGPEHRDCPAHGPTIAVTPSPPRPAGPVSDALEELPEEARAAAARGDARLHQYVLVRQVGRGGMGAVWKAWDTALSRWVAIKFLLGSDDADIRRFRREAKLSAGLQHPHIAAVYEVGTAPAAHAGATPAPFLVMQFIDGRSMGEQTFPLAETVGHLVRVAEAVEAAHRSGVVHRDLKPQNIMVSAEGRPYVMDFGLAKVIQADSSLSMTGMVVGTPAYMPPEQALGKTDAADARSDVYSLGATIYALVCGRPPYVGEAAMDIVLRVLREAPLRPRKISEQIPEALERIILKAMARRPEDRYPTAALVAEDLRRFLGNEPVQAVAPPSGIRSAARSPGRWIAAAVALLLLAAGALAVWYARPRAEGVDASAEWRSRWKAERPSLSYGGFEAAGARRAGELLRKAPASEAEDLRDWLGGEIRSAARDATAWAAEPRSGWSSRRAAAERWLAWAGALEPHLKGTPLGSELAKARAAAEPVARFAGEFTLRIYVRGGVLAGLRRGGTPLPLPADCEAPLRLTLEAGDYEVDVEQPASGKATLKLRGDPDRTLTVVGDAGRLRLAAP